jgi:DNA-binding response OmpR family regulator
LLVDDDPEVCLSIAEALMEDGFDFTMAADAEEAWRDLQRTEFDLVICDLHLRGKLNGAELTHNVERDTFCRSS